MTKKKSELQYYLPDLIIRVSSENSEILDAVDYYFKVYKNLKSLFFNRRQNSQKKLDIRFIDRSKFLTQILNNQLSNILHKKNLLAKYKKRYEIYRLAENIETSENLETITTKEILINFYNHTCIIKLNLDTCEAIGYFFEINRFGNDFLANFIIIPLIEILYKFQNRFFVHSSVLMKPDDNAAIMFVGNSGSGKTTLTLYHQKLKSYKIITDDKAYLYKNPNNSSIYCGGILQPFDIVKTKDKFLIENKLLDFQKISWFENEKYFIAQKFSRDIISAPAYLKTIVFPKIQMPKNDIKSLTKTNALTELMKHSITPGLTLNLKEHFEILSAAVEQAEAFSVEIKDSFEFLKDIL